MFFTDQQRWDTTGIHGNPLELTPNFDRFATSGTHVVHSFTCQPVCGPARSCLQTGLYATQTGVVHNGVRMDPGRSVPTRCWGYSVARSAASIASAAARCLTGYPTL